MCGIAGIVTSGDLTRYIEPIKILASMVSSRGIHSTGIAVINSDGKYLVHKSTRPSWTLSRALDFKKILGERNNILMIHARHATSGKICEANAHPFAMGSILGMHNGVLSESLKGPNNCDFDVDSQLIFHRLDETRNNYKKVFDRLNGNVTSVWVNRDSPGVLYIAVNGTPMAILRSKNAFCYGSYLDFMLAVYPHFGGIPQIISDETFIRVSIKKSGKLDVDFIEDCKFGFTRGTPNSNRHTAEISFIRPKKYIQTTTAVITHHSGQSSHPNLGIVGNAFNHIHGSTNNKSLDDRRCWLCGVKFNIIEYDDMTGEPKMYICYTCNGIIN